MRAMLQATQNDFKKFKETVKSWPKLSRSLAVIQTPKQYQRAVTFLDFLIDTVGKNEKHSLADLMNLMGVLIEDYENKHVQEPKGDPISNLKFLMEQHQLTQRDLPELGSQGVVSEILHRKRKLNVRQIKALSKHFNVSPLVFIEEN